MLTNSEVFATVAVMDLQKSKEFYQGVLGLRQIDENVAGVMYQCGGGRLFTYQSGTAGKNQATSASFEVDEIDQIATDLKNKGVEFVNYDESGLPKNGDVYSMGDMKAAWFKDPDGNILNLSYTPRQSH